MPCWKTILPYFHVWDILMQNESVVKMNSYYKWLLSFWWNLHFLSSLARWIKINTSPIESLQFDLHQKSTSSLNCKNMTLMWPNIGVHIFLWLMNGLLLSSHTCIRSTSDSSSRQIWQASSPKRWNKRLCKKSYMVV